MRRAVGRKARPASLTKMGRKRLRLKVSADSEISHRDQTPATVSGSPEIRTRGIGCPATQRGSSAPCPHRSARARASSRVIHSSSGRASAVRASKQARADSLPSSQRMRQ